MKNIKQFILESCNSFDCFNYNNLIKQIKTDYFEDFGFTAKDMNKIKKMLNPYKDKTFELVDSYNMYSPNNSLAVKLIPEDWDPDKDENTIDFVDLLDGECNVFIKKYNNQLYFVNAINADDCPIYLIK